MKSHYREVPEKRSPLKHASPWHKKIALENTVLRTEVGSGLHGTSVSEYDDRDEMGICIEPPDAVIGFKQFEQYQWYTAWERLPDGVEANDVPAWQRPESRRNRSGAGDLDLTIYSLRKWMRLAMNGNPTVLLLMFAPFDKVVEIGGVGTEIRDGQLQEKILSRLAGPRFAGYLRTQRNSMLSHEGKGRDVTRPELIERFGFDTKFAAHMVRLGFQGVELLGSGQITLPMPVPQRDICIAIRHGTWSMANCLALAEELEMQIEALTGMSPLRPEPDYEYIDQWLSGSYRIHWMLKEAGYRP